MKRFLQLGLLMVVLTSSLPGQQAYRPLETPAYPEGDAEKEWYTVGGERHGISYFKKHEFPEVEYTTGEELTFDKYHSTEVTYAWLELWAEKYPNLVDLYEAAESFEGRPILQLTLTNKETGKDTDKPAAYVEGGRHSGEVTSSESVLWLIQ
ncbi:MAG: peptidase, partial [Acidobacteriota bacterium]